MARIRPFALADMSEEQRRIYSEIVAGKRGRVPAPLEIWLRSPQLAGHAQKLGEFVRYQTSLSPRLSELAILVTARFWTSHYEWAAHKKMALQAGLNPALIEAIARRQPPHFEHLDEQLVYDFSQAAHRDHKVADDLYQSAIATLGEQAVIELVGLLGYYTLISMTLNVFEVEVREGETPELED
jgi:4-carboxymuconolactone decarboxylase